MELNDFKTLWLRYEHKLTENLKLNEALLRNTNLNAFRKELQKPLLYEQLSAALAAVLIPVFLLISLQYTGQPKFLFSGLVCCLVLTAQLLLGIRKLKRFYAIDHYGAPLIVLQEQLTQLRLIILRSRKLELALIPFLIIPVITLLMKVMHNIDVFVDTKTIVIYALAGISGTMLATVLINKYLYDKKIKNLNTILSELKNYRAEN